MKKSSRRIATACVAISAAAWLAGCNGGSQPSGPLETPVFVSLSIPDPNDANVWMPVSLTPTPEVLPTRGRSVRISFTAPVGSTFAVSVRTLGTAGAVTPLPENRGAAAPPETGYFNIVSVDTSSNPPVYLIYTRAPADLSDPANYNMEIVNKSLNTNRTDSAPLVVALSARKVFSVTVTVDGDGHVESNPAGILCGRSPSGRLLDPCTAVFNAGTVSLAPGSNDLNTTRFLRWTGNCAPNVQVCVVTLTGEGPTVANAVFGPSTIPNVPSACVAAPLIAGLRWIDTPECATGHPGITLICDALGYICCEPGSSTDNNARCGGAGKIGSEPDCRHRAPRGMLRQPGGCYEVDSDW